MKKLLVSTVAAVGLVVVTASGASAAGHDRGMPGKHGVDGRTFGAVVSNAAQTDVWWLVGHVSGR
jgi:hypothetical protein